MAKRKRGDIQLWADRIGWSRRIKAVCKPCWEIKYCPYGPVVEGFPLGEDTDERTCRIFGHHCPVFYVAEPLTETKELRNISRTIPRPLQFRVLKRDNQICASCRQPVLDANIHFDHIIPWSRGGPTAEHNIRLLCDECNRKRGARFEAEHLVSSVVEHTMEPVGSEFVNLLIHFVREAQAWLQANGRLPNADEVARIVGVRKPTVFEHRMAQMLLDMQELFDGKAPAEIPAKVFHSLGSRWGFGRDGTVGKINTIARRTNVSTADLIAAEASMLRRLGWPVRVSAEEQKRWARL
jgi:hypothetical protein